MQLQITDNCSTLESVEAVCSQLQVDELFVSRDEMIAFKLPDSLSRMTRLANNHILPIPLAINLSSVSSASSPSFSTSSPSSASTFSSSSPQHQHQQHQHQQKEQHQQQNHSQNQKNCSDITRIVLSCGQVLRVCGIYENVLPMLDSRQQKNFKNSKHKLVSSSSKAQKSTTTITTQSNSPNSFNIAPLPALHYYQPHFATPNCATRQQIYANPSPQYANFERAHNCSKNTKIKNNKSSSSSSKPNLVDVERYVRCIAVCDKTVEALTSPSSDCCSVQGKRRTELSKQTNTSEQREEFEVLIPLSTMGRFYVCASKQTLVDALYGCQMTLNPNLVFTLEQITTLLSLSSRVGGTSGVDCANFACKTQRARHRCRRRLLRLPMSVNLVFGSRPATYSPSMFGMSTTLESYFANEANIAGHKLDCFFNKANSSQITTTKTTSACRCCYTTQNSFGFFSAALRLETIKHRNVIAACTIKSNPLVTITDIDEQLLLSASLSKLKLEQQLKKTKLETLEQSPHKNDRCVSSSTCKSSFSRLRACRSLMSLNGHKRKQRPKIPQQLVPADRCYESNNLISGHFDSLKALQANVSNGERVVFLEFDCSDFEIKFVRTFMDSSLPASSIPETVLRRLELCASVTSTWESHLKLSYVHLAQDFDAYSRQLNSNRLLNCRKFADTLDANNATKQQIRRQMPVKLTSNARIVTEKPLHLSAASWSTSRSSSGVSSAGERQALKAAAAALAVRTRTNQTQKTTTTTTFISKSSADGTGKSSLLSQAMSSTASNSSVSNRSASGGGGSKLARLVQRFMPNCEAQEKGRHASLMNEMSRRFTKDVAPRADLFLNAKKIAERRLFTTKQDEHLYESLEQLRNNTNNNNYNYKRPIVVVNATNCADTMEPVSIEACDEQLLSMLDSSDTDSGGSSLAESERRNSMSEIDEKLDDIDIDNNEQESFYVNLTRNSSLLALGERTSNVKMERRLKKARARRIASQSTPKQKSSSCFSMSQLELRISELDDRLNDKADFRSLGNFASN